MTGTPYGTPAGVTLVAFLGVASGFEKAWLAPKKTATAPSGTVADTTRPAQAAAETLPSVGTELMVFRTCEAIW